MLATAEIVAAMDVFPATLRICGDTYRGARLFVDEQTNRAYAFHHRGSRPVLVASGEVQTRSEVSGSDGVVTLEDGTDITWTRSNGCGCGNPLKSKSGTQLLTMGIA